MKHLHIPYINIIQHEELSKTVNSTKYMYIIIYKHWCLQFSQEMDNA